MINIIINLSCRCLFKYISFDTIIQIFKKLLEHLILSGIENYD